jgi:Na+/proline symporter
VWTDTLQSFSMITGLVVVAVVSTLEAGGFGLVLQRASDSGRFEFFK